METSTNYEQTGVTTQGSVENVSIQSNGSVPKPRDNELQELRKGFTSENFKIEVNGLPKFFGVGEAKKLFKKLKLNSHKFKPVGGASARYMFVNFSNEDDKNQAIKILDGYKLKGSTLRAFSANAAKDPLLKHRDTNSHNHQNSSENNQETKPASDRIAEAVCPLWAKCSSYEEQLKLKLEDVQRLMRKLRGEYLRQLPLLKDINNQNNTNVNETIAKIEPIVPSPVINGYRNKCEFSIGKHPESGEIVVGFRLASYKKGSLSVVDIGHLPQVSDKMKKIVLYFQKLVRNGDGELKLDPYDPLSQTGYWRQLTVRTSRNGGIMVLIVIHPQSLDEDRRTLIKQNLVMYFDRLKNTPEEVSSLQVQFFGQKEKGSEDPPFELLSGTSSISETLMEEKLAFQISPQSFFQVNVKSAENLYNVCAKLAGLENQQSDTHSGLRSTVLFDVCCGTGTIGLCLASRCKKVIGVDCVTEAVDNANDNAKFNNVLNAKFHSGRAEFILGELLKHESLESNSEQKIVAIVDPPRAGLHPKAIKALRAATEIHTLVYVSCDANAAMQSLIDLGRPPSNTYRGDPFIPKKVVPVDLFPHTNHIELVILYERMPLIQMAQSNDSTEKMMDEMKPPNE